MKEIYIPSENEIQMKFFTGFVIKIKHRYFCLNLITEITLHTLMGYESLKICFNKF